MVISGGLHFSFKCKFEAEKVTHRLIHCFVLTCEVLYRLEQMNHQSFCHLATAAAVRTETVYPTTFSQMD